MRFLSLRLIAFGPFEDRTLEFSAKPDALTIVYGPNEAGKSTSLRALEGFLFGIDSTQDAHKHPAPNLRVGGAVETASGEVLRLVRRRGRKATLRDESEQPVDEEVLRSLMRGIDREAFRTLYGLDHHRLREGARALLEENSSLSESLFEAGLSGAGVARLLGALRDEADGIFTPRATTRPLNEALRLYAASTKNARQYATPVAKYQMQIDAIGRAKERRAKAEEDLRALDKRRRRLERGRRVVPSLAARKKAVEQKNALGAVVTLPLAAADERERASTQRAEAEAAIATLTEKAAELRAQVELLSSTSVRVDATDAIQTLSQLVGACRDEAQRRELGETRDRLASKLAAHDQEVAIVAPDPEVERALEAALAARDDASLPLERAELDLAELTLTKEALATTLASVDPDGAGPIEGVRFALAAVDAALAHGRELEASRRRAAEMDAAAAKAFSAVGSPMSLEAFARTVAPAPEEIEAWMRAYGEAMHDLARLDARLREIDDARAALQQERTSILSKGDVATDEDLNSARTERDAAVDALRDATGAGTVRALVRSADDVVDRMRAEAERTARVRMIDRTLEGQETTRAATTTERAQTMARARGVACEASGRARTAGAWEAEDPRRLTSFWERRRMFLEIHHEALKSHALALALQDERSRAFDALARAMGEGPRSDDEIEVASRARAMVAAAERRAVERERTSARLEETEKAELKARAKLASARATSEARKRAAESSLLALGLDAQSTREVALAAIRRAREIARTREELARAQAQIDRVAESEAKLARYCETLARSMPSVAPAGDPLAVANVLLAELRRAEKQAAHAREAELFLRETQDRLSDAQERRRSAELVLAGAVERAAVTEVAELPEAERRSALALSLDAEIARLEAQLHAAGDGARIEELEAEFAGFDLEQADLEQEVLDAEREELEREKDKAAQERASAELGLPKFEESDAALHAEHAQVHLARARSLALRYAKLKLASVVLEREIETYRRLHQAPVLARAEEHFRRLTKDSFTELRAIIDDHDRPELVCVRDGQEVAIEGLSDGAKDQLFLALRLATIERHAKNTEPMPLVLDDILVNFDDERSRAALDVLAGIAPTMQVLLFTHHESVVELAKEAAGSRVQVVSLAPG